MAEQVNTNSFALTDAASANVAIGVRGGVVPVRGPRTAVRPVVPVAPEDDGVLPMLPSTFLFKYPGA